MGPETGEKRGDLLGCGVDTLAQYLLGIDHVAVQVMRRERSRHFALPTSHTPHSGSGLHIPHVLVSSHQVTPHTPHPTLHTQALAYSFLMSWSAVIKFHGPAPVPAGVWRGQCERRSLCAFHPCFVAY